MVTKSDHSDVENTDKETLSNRLRQSCPENDSEHDDVHSYDYEMPETGAVDVRCVCDFCGSVLGEWETTDLAVSATNEEAIGECPGCNNITWVNQVGGRLVDGQVWHESCLLRDKYGYESVPEGEDRPYSKNASREFNLHRKVETTINGETFEWDEWEVAGPFGDHAKHNLPTRDQLTPEQLETLREWALGDNPTGDDPESSGHGTFPAQFVLQGGYVTEAPEAWGCPDCGNIVKPKKSQYGMDLEAECAICGSDRWLTEGRPIGIGGNDGLDALSDRERQVVVLDSFYKQTDREIADTLEIEVSTVREYRERARQKAKRGKKLFDAMVSMGHIEAGD